MSNNTSKDSWDGLLTNFLKADNLKESEEDFACVDVTVEEKDMSLVLVKEDKKYIFSLNVTNKVFIKDADGIEVPKDIIGKRVTLKKVLANESTKQRKKLIL